MLKAQNAIEKLTKQKSLFILDLLFVKKTNKPKIEHITKVNNEATAYEKFIFYFTIERNR